ncbi:multidrug transporter MatE [Bacillaceae bacterium JMAK1]|nr:multidrug transporter MatE [Bacillaceae bacterium JMAK1]
MSIADRTLQEGLRTSEKIKIILVLAMPAVIENFFQTLLGFVDTLFVAQVGLEEVTAVGVTNAILAIYFAVFMAIGVGVNVLMANARGEGNDRRATKIAQQGIIQAIIVGLFLGVITLFFAENLIRLLGVEPEVLQLATVYFQILAIPSIIMALMFVLSSILRGTGDTKSPMKAVIIANVVNMVFDYLLIFGFLFIPPLGIVGAAIAGVLARVVGVGMLLYYVRKNDSIDLKKKRFRFNLQDQKDLLGLGAPAAGERLAMRIGQVVYFGFIVGLGTSTFSAHQIAGNIETFSYMIAYGFAAAATIIVGRLVGAKQYEQAKSYAKLIALISAGFMVFMGILLFIFGEWMGSFFTDDPVVQAEIGTALKIAAFFQPFLAILLILTGAFQGARNTKYPMYLTTVGMWLIRTVFVYVLAIQFELGIAGVWLAIGIDIVIRAAVLWYRVETNRWIKPEKKRSRKEELRCHCDPQTKQAQMSGCVNNY